LISDHDKDGFNFSLRKWRRKFKFLGVETLLFTTLRLQNENTTKTPVSHERFSTATLAYYRAGAIICARATCLGNS